MLIIGEGYLRNNLDNLVKSLNLKDRIIFLGEIPNPYPYLAKCSVLVHCSRWEGLPNVMLEAIALDKFIISSDCRSGPSEIIINKKNGLLFEVNNLDKLVSSLLKYFDKTSKYKKGIIAKFNLRRNNTCI